MAFPRLHSQPECELPEPGRHGPQRPRARSEFRTSTTNRSLDSAVRRWPDQTHTHLPQICRGVGPQLEREAILEHRRGRAAKRIEALHNTEQTHTIRDVRTLIEPGDAVCT